jgi:regulatory protein YycH of two-component signal transduction system YycFG
VFDRVVELALKVANPIYVYAFDTSNNRLLQKVNVNKSMFYHNHDRETLTLAKIILDEANAYSTALTDYGVNNADIAELESVISQFEGLITAPSGVIGERKLYTSNLRELFVATDSIIYDKLDKFIGLFKSSKPEFFALYSNARNIVNTAARKRKDKAAEEEEV